MTETWTGRAACLLLALVWFVSMGVADANAYSYTPLLAGLVPVILLAVSAMIRGAKVVQLSKTAWISLGVGAYFLIRCLCSPSVVESWQEASTILGCGIFYVAGIYAAQGRSLRTVLWLLVIAGVLNLVYFGLMQYTDVPMEWAGRPAVGPGSINHRPVTLFVYKNHAAGFLCMVGMLLFAAALWVKTNGRNRLMMCLIALACVLISAECHSRAPYLMAPVMLICGWVLRVIIKLYEDDKVGGGTLLSGFIILGALGVAICSFLFDTETIQLIAKIDSDGRFAIWKETCRVLPETPIWGNGALTLQWHIMSRPNLSTPFFTMINFAHNEYLQAWADYGIIGLGCMVYVVVWHLYRGIRVLTSEDVSSTGRVMTAFSLLCLVGWSVCCMVDFFWHHFAIAGMTAFAAGIAAAPYPYTSKGIRRKVAVQSARGKSFLALSGVCVVGVCLWLIFLTLPAWAAQWEFNKLANNGTDPLGDKRHELIRKLVPLYPATTLMDQYFRIPRHRDNWEQETELLKQTLAANPLQLHTASMLAELLSRHGQFEEAETIYRQFYSADGSDRTALGDWANMYALNILRRGQYLWATGNLPAAYSLMRYGLSIVQSQSRNWSIDMSYRRQEHLWQESGKYMPQWQSYIKSREQDVAVMKMLKVEPDDSWQAPDASGKPALYRRYGAPESIVKADSAASAPAAAKKE